MRSAFRPRTATISLVAVMFVCLGGSLFGLGCPPGSTPPPGGDRPIPDETEIVILDPTESRTVTVGTLIPVSYQIIDAPEELLVSAYLLRLGPDPIKAGIESNLSPEGQTISLSTAGLAPGEFLVIVAIRTGESSKESSATTAEGEPVVITVVSQGTIVFTAPSSSGPYAIGSTILIEFSLSKISLSDPDPGALFRVFHDRDGLANGNETLIDLGRGDDIFNGVNLARIQWDTRGLLPGRYYIGVTGEGKGRSTTEFVTDEEGLLLPIHLEEEPAIVVTAPAVDRRVTTDSDEEVVISFLARARDTPATIDVFLDLDRDFSNGIFKKLNSAGLDITTTTFLMRPAEHEPNVYFIGASVNPSNMVNDPVAAYAPGRLEIITGNRPSMVLTCVAAPGETCSTCPLDPPTITPGDDLKNLSLNIAEGLTVVWRAFDDNSKLVDMAVYLDPDRFPLSGNELLIDRRTGVTGPLLPDHDCFEARIGPGETVESLDQLGAKPGQIYNYLLVVSDNDPDDSTTPDDPDGQIKTYAPVTLQVQGRDVGTRWVGAAGQLNGGIPGARIIGSSPNDRSGAILRDIGDFDRDGLDDFMIGTQQPGGTGNARLIFGSTGRILGTEVRIGDLRGSFYAGIPGNGSLGLSDVAVLPDVDNDGDEELVFGFPHVNTSSTDVYGAPGHFVSGGIVIVSSMNFGGVGLNAVGRFFNCAEGDPCPHFGPPDAVCDPAWLPSDDPSAPCFQPPLVTLSCGSEPECPCLSPSMYPGMWPGGEIGDGWSTDDINQGQQPPYGARILGPKTRDTTVGLLDCDLNDEPDDPPTYSRSTRVFDSSGRFGTILQTGASGTLLVSDPQPGSAGRVYQLFTRNFWKSRLEFGTTCIWGSPEPDEDPFPCDDFMDFSVPRPHQYILNQGGAGARTFTGGAGGLANVAEWSVDTDFQQDMLFGAPEDVDDAGSLTLLLGKDLLGSPIDVSQVTNDDADPSGGAGFRGTKIIGEAGYQLGQVQPLTVDFNGDNKEDLLVGIPEANLVLVIFGGVDLDGNGRLDLVERPQPATNPWTIRELIEQELAVSFEGDDNPQDEKLGYAISSPGDIDGDLIDDIMLSTPGADHVFITELAQPAESGDTTIFVQSRDGIVTGVQLEISGEQDRFTVVSVTDDVDAVTGQVIYRVVLDLPLVNDHSPEAGGLVVSTRPLVDIGKVFVIFGQRDILNPIGRPPSVFVKVNGQPQARRYRIGSEGVPVMGTVDFPSTIYVGRRAGDRLGGFDTNSGVLGPRRLFGSPGDVDGDGFNDVLIGAPMADPLGVRNAGEVYVIYGGS